MIFDWFEKYVQTHSLDIGDPLPTVERIMQETGMSRSSVREAMTRLQTIGVVDIRRKRGMILRRSPSLLELIRAINSDVLPHDLVGHFGGFRCALELGLESEIFQRATSQDSAELRAIYEEMMAHCDDPDHWHDLDRRFHERLLRITSNKVVIWLSQLLLPFFETYRGHVSSISERTKEIHGYIVAGLENRNPDLFHKGIWEHDHWKLAYEAYQ